MWTSPVLSARPAVSMSHTQRHRRAVHHCLALAYTPARDRTRQWVPGIIHGDPHASLTSTCCWGMSPGSSQVGGHRCGDALYMVCWHARGGSRERTLGGGALSAAARRARQWAPMWVVPAVGHWCLTSALHTVTPAMAVRVFWAKMQYLAIPSVPPLWLLFALDYGQWRGVAGARLALLWAIPLLTLALAWTHAWHGWLWSSITP